MKTYTTPELEFAAFTLQKELQAAHPNLRVKVKPDASHGGLLMVRAYRTPDAIVACAAAYLATLSETEQLAVLDLARKGDGSAFLRSLERSPLTDARGHLIGSSTSTGFPLVISHAATLSSAAVAYFVARDLAA